MAAEVLDVSSAARSYAGGLLVLRLLRGVLANAAFAVVLLAVLALGLAAGAVLTALGGSPLAGRLALGTGLAVGAVLLTGAVGVGVALLYAGAARASAAVARVLLVVAALVLLVSAADLVVQLLTLGAAAPGERGSHLLSAASDLFPAYVAVAFGYGATGLLRLARDPGQYLVAPGVAPPGRWWRRWLALAGVPHQLGQRPDRLRTAAALGALAFVCEGFAFSAYFSAAGGRPPEVPLLVALVVVLVGWPIGLGLFFGLLAAAQHLWVTARRTAQPTLVEALAADRRAPVLFLRSFTDDQVSLTAARVPAYLRLVDPGVSRRRFEELLVVGTEGVGPLIAIGNPRDPRRPVGASRAYFGDGEWQEHVLAHMDRARLIVVALSTTDALGWELDRIHERGHLSKCYFVVPPALAGEVDTLAPIARRAGLDLTPPPAGLTLLAAWCPTPGATTLACSTRAGELDHDVALRRFLGTCALGSDQLEAPAG